jgi:hypothetical protein
MAPEIADSDAESDIIAQEATHQDEQISPRATRRSGTVRDNATQHLSDFDSSSRKGTGSTDRLIRDIYQPTYDGAGDEDFPPSEYLNMGERGHNKRRAHSDAFGISPSGAEESTKKRAKTYGSKTRDVEPDLFCTGPPQMELQHNNSTRKSPDPAVSHRSASSNALSPSRVGRRERDRPRRVLSLMNAPQHITTSTSSMGGYQSIELDFRGGIDVNTNPFGTLSQLSTDDVELQENCPSASEQLNEMLDHFANPDIQTQMITSPVRQGTPIRPTVEPLSETERDGNSLAADPQGPSGVDEPSLKRRKTDGPTPSYADNVAQPRRAASVAAESAPKSSAKSQTSKRDWPKSKMRDENTDESADDEPVTGDMCPPSIDHSQGNNLSRAYAMDQSSQASQSSQPASNTKKKRQTTKRVVKVTEEPKKHPSSELGLNDESVIGLPKDQYKPRPSRSRSKRLTDQDEPPNETGTPSKNIEEPAAVITPVPDTSASKSSTSKSKGKKTKVKRAKTSAAALLKPSAPMLSEGEDDVVWVESKPTSVKLDLPPDLPTMKKESRDSKGELSEDELQRDEAVVGLKQLVSVEIPLAGDPIEAQSDGASDSKPKKKRGRPKKVDKEKELALFADKGGDSASTQSTEAVPRALAAKDPNTSTTIQTQPKRPAKSKAIVTDSDDEDAAESEVQGQATGNGSKAARIPAPVKTTPATDEDKENGPLTTKSASATTMPSSSDPTNTTPEKKPTHSPLKPTPLSSSSLLTRHRVGLSRRTRIPSLLRKVDRHKPPPTKTGVKVKELKIKGVNDGGEGEGDGGEEEGKWTGVLRDKDGGLVEWDF